MRRSVFVVMLACVLTALTSRAAGEPEGAEAGDWTLFPGTLIAATSAESHAWRRDALGEILTATVSADVANGYGRVVIPAGSALRLRMKSFAPAAPDMGGVRVILDVLFVTVRGRQYSARGRGELLALAVYPLRGGVVVVAPQAEILCVLSQGFTAVLPDVPQ